VPSDRQFDKEGRWNFRKKAKKRRRTTFEKVGSYYKIQQNMFLERVGGCYYKNKTW